MCVTFPKGDMCATTSADKKTWLRLTRRATLSEQNYVFPNNNVLSRPDAPLESPVFYPGFIFGQLACDSLKKPSQKVQKEGQFSKKTKRYVTPSTTRRV